MPVDKFGRMSNTKTKDTGVSLTYINNNYIRSDGGTPVSDSINMNGNTLYNVSDPVNPQDVATKEYADTTNKAFVLYEGKYLAVGDLSMGGRRLNDVGMPLENHQASNKFYVDTIVETATAGDKALRKIQDGIFQSNGDIDMNGNSISGLPNPIDRDAAANKNYVEEKGPLGDGHYEFSFGNGSSGSEHAYGGYCMSASGRIIRGSLTVTQSKIILAEEVKVNIVLNGKEQVNQSIVKESGDICSCTIFRDPIELKQCDIINFISRTTNNKITNAYVSILIELDL